MNWLSNFIRPKINSLVNNAKDVPDNLWEKCPGCDGMLFHRDLKAAQNVCYHCGHHLRIDVFDRLKNLFDDGKYKTLWRQEVWRPNANKAAVIGDIEMVCLDKEKRLHPIPAEILIPLTSSEP